MRTKRFPPRPRFRIVPDYKWQGFVDVHHADANWVNLWFDAESKTEGIYDCHTVTWEWFARLVGSEIAAQFKAHVLSRHGGEEVKG